MSNDPTSSSEQTPEAGLSVIPKHDPTLSKRALQVLKATTCKGCSDTQMYFIAETCERYQLDPFLGEIHWWLDKHGNLKKQIGIDAFRKRRWQHPQFEYSVGPEFCGEDGKWTDLWLKQGNPVAARFGIKRKDRPDVVYCAPLLFRENTTGKGNWTGRPLAMFGKCAEGAGTRFNLPDAFSGMYIEGEEQDGDAIEVQIEEPTADEKDKQGVAYYYDLLGYVPEKQEHLERQCNGNLRIVLEKLEQECVSRGITKGVPDEAPGDDIPDAEIVEDPPVGGGSLEDYLGDNPEEEPNEDSEVTG